MPERRILLGVVGRPHGVRGLVRVHSYTADPAALAGYGPLLDDRGRSWTIAWRGDGIAELRDAAGRPPPDRTAAEALVNTRLYLDRDRLPPPEEDADTGTLTGEQFARASGLEAGQLADCVQFGLLTPDAEGIGSGADVTTAVRLDRGTPDPGVRPGVRIPG